MQYLIKSITGALFAAYDLTNKLDLAQSLNRRVKQIFDGEPVLFPIPNDAPPEIPRIIFTSKSQLYRCNIAIGRLDFLYTQPSEPIKELIDIHDEYLAILRHIAEVVKGEWKADVFRLGLVVGALAFPDDPVELIKSTFIRDGSLKAPNQLEVHVLDKMTWDKLEINRWYRLSTVVIPAEQGERKALSIVFDVNTTPEKRYDFGTESIVSFYDQALVYVSNSLKMLFPV